MCRVVLFLLSLGRSFVTLALPTLNSPLNPFSTISITLRFLKSVTVWNFRQRPPSQNIETNVLCARASHLNYITMDLQNTKYFMLKHNKVYNIWCCYFICSLKTRIITLCLVSKYAQARQRRLLRRKYCFCKIAFFLPRNAQARLETSLVQFV